MGKLDEIKATFDAEVEKLQQFERERTKCMSNRRQLESQLTENTMVKTELDMLEAGANVYKLIGPVMVKQDLEEAKQNVEKRIAYIRTEIDRVESLLGDSTKNIEEQKESVEKLRDKLKQALAASAAPTPTFNANT